MTTTAAATTATTLAEPDPAAAAELRECLNRARLAKIPGYFPTPPTNTENPS